MTVIPSRYVRADLTLPRQRTPDNTQWQSSRAPLEPLWKELVTGLFIVLFIAVIVMVTA